jgi:hypothetical protein
MCPAFCCSPSRLLALMESANRGLMIQTGSTHRSVSRRWNSDSALDPATLQQSRPLRHPLGPSTIAAIGLAMMGLMPGIRRQALDGLYILAARAIQK